MAAKSDAEKAEEDRRKEIATRTAEAEARMVAETPTPTQAENDAVARRLYGEDGERVAKADAGEPYKTREAKKG